MQNKPIRDKEEIPQNPDKKIDQDFDGFPGGTSTEQTIKPETPEEEKTADLEHKDGEKRIIKPDQRKGLDEQNSDGSANAFEGK